MPIKGGKTFWKEFQYHCIHGRCYSADIQPEIRYFDIYGWEKIFFEVKKSKKNRFFQNRSKSHIYVYSASKTCLETPKGHFLAIYTYISHYLTLYKKSNFWKKSRFLWILAIFDKSRFGRLAGRKWPESWFILRNVFSRHFKSLFIW